MYVCTLHTVLHIILLQHEEYYSSFRKSVISVQIVSALCCVGRGVRVVQIALKEKSEQRALVHIVQTNTNTYITQT